MNWAGPAASTGLTPAQITAHDRQRELGPDGERQLIRVFGSVFPADGLVADVGGSTGVATPLLAAAGLRVALLDISASMLAACSCAVPRMQADLCRLPLRDRRVEGIHAAYVIQNIPDWRQALAEVARVVKPGGRVLVALGDPPADEVTSRVTRHYLDALTDAAARRVGVAAESTGLRSAGDVVAVLRELGLELADVHEIGGQQMRSVRDVIEIRSRNPFLTHASDQSIDTARAQTLQWAAGQYGDLDRPRSVPVRRTLHEFRYLADRA